MNCMVGAMRMHAPGNKTRQPVYSGAWNAFRSFDQKTQGQGIWKEALVKVFDVFYFLESIKIPQSKEQ